MRGAHPGADALVVLVVGIVQQHAAAIAHDVRDDRAGHAQIAAERLLAMLLALHAELAAALVLDQHTDVLGLREQIEERVDQLLEQRFCRVTRRRGVQDLGERVELAFDQANRALLGQAEQTARDDRRARVGLDPALDHGAGRADVDDRDRVALGVLLAVAGDVARLDPDPVVRDQDLVVVTQRGRLLQPHAVDERAVVRAEILERPAFAFLPQPRVLTRHAHVGHEDLAVGAPADHVLAVRQLVPPPGDRTGQEHERRHDRSAVYHRSQGFPES
ncbi:MAG: hypothetical protein WKG01_24370 [Kofleriaceae bacterium]